MYRYVLAIVILSLTAGCVGNTDRVTLPAPMPMSDEEARTRYHDVLANANLELVSAVLGYKRGSDNLYLFREPQMCEGAACAEAYTLEGISLQILGEDRGVPRVNESFQDGEQRVWVYGGWMENSFFAIQGNQYLDPHSRGYGLTQLVGYAVGYSPGTNPDIGSVSGRWNGLMLGIDVGGWPNRGDVLSGDAAIVVEVAGDGVQADVFFTGIVDDLDVPRTDMTWEDLRLEAGRFGHDGGVTDNLAGAFFGTEHGEVAGTFFRDAITGAFGGVRE